MARSIYGCVCVLSRPLLYIGSLFEHIRRVIYFLLLGLTGIDTTIGYSDLSQDCYL